MEETVRTLQQKVRRYEKATDKITFISDIMGLCNNAGYFADYPKETKAFWSKFAQDCIENNDRELNQEVAKFFKKKSREVK